MGRQRKNIRKSAPPAPAVAPRSVWLPRQKIVGLLAIIALTFSVAMPWVLRRTTPPVTPQVTVHPATCASAYVVPSLEKLLVMPPKELEQVDVAAMNLLCATALPGAEKLDIPRCLAQLDAWAAKVRAVTQRHLYRAHDPQYAAHYKHSEKWLKAEFLAQVLQEDCGVHYNLARVRAIDFTRSKDLFIHGMIDDPNGGTCASMPVLYVAVGRRLGYPLKLVLTKAHIFARWEDDQDRFNIETTSTGGVDSYPDDYYKTWPEKLSDTEVKANRYLVSLSPTEELAVFLANRGHCLLDNGRTKEAQDAYMAAQRLASDIPVYAAWVRQAENRLRPSAFVDSTNGGIIERPKVYGNPLEEVERINASNRKQWEPPIPSIPQPDFMNRGQNPAWPQSIVPGTTPPQSRNGLGVSDPSY